MSRNPQEKELLFILLLLFLFLWLLLMFKFALLLLDKTRDLRTSYREGLATEKGLK